jgi:hypothetical protein
MKSDFSSIIPASIVLRECGDGLRFVEGAFFSVIGEGGNCGI